MHTILISGYSWATKTLAKKNWINVEFKVFFQGWRVSDSERGTEREENVVGLQRDTKWNEAGDGQRDARETKTRTDRRRTWQKMWFGVVFWAAFFICPPWQRGRVTGIGRNWIGRLNNFSSSSYPSPFFLPSTHLFLPFYLFSCSFDEGNVVEIVGRDELAKCS